MGQATILHAITECSFDICFVLFFLSFDGKVISLRQNKQLLNIMLTWNCFVEGMYEHFTIT